MNPTPTPSPTPAFDEAAVTPGVIGFLVTAALFVAVGLLVWSLVRRISRLQHRELVRAQLAAERAEAESGRIGAGAVESEAADGTGGAGGTARTTGDGPRPGGAEPRSAEPS